MIVRGSRLGKRVRAIGRSGNVGKGHQAIAKALRKEGGRGLVPPVLVERVYNTSVN